VVLGGIVRDVVAVDDVVVPVTLTLLESSTLELEGADPTTGLLGVLGKGKLALVAVPGTEKVDGLQLEEVRRVKLSWIAAIVMFVLSEVFKL
jgi:hypothetical protein